MKRCLNREVQQLEGSQVFVLFSLDVKPRLGLRDCSLGFQCRRLVEACFD